MANKNPNKPVNDLIKFWAEKQDKDVEPTSRSLRRPLSPNTSLPPSPLNDSFFSKNSPKDISSYSPPISPIKQSYSIHSLISEESNNNDNNRNSNSNISDNNNNNNNNNSNNPTIPTSISKKNEENDSLNKEISTTSTIRLRDYDSNKRDNKFGGPLPPVRKVTDLVSRFEKVTSPNNSVTTSPRLTPLKRSQTYAQSSPASPTALSPISRNQPSPEPISLSYSAKSRRRQTVPEPLNLSLKKTDDSDVVSKQIYDDSTTVSPISSIGNLSVEIPDFKPISTLNLDQSSKKNAITPTKEYVPEVQPEKKQTDSIQQESSLKINNIQSQKIVSESIPNPTGVVIIKKSEPEPLKQQQQQQQEERKNPTSPILSSAHSDYLDFLSETLQNSTIIQPLQTPVIPLSYPENRNNKPASLLSSETKTSVSKTKKFNIKSKTFTSRDIKSKNIPNVNNEPHHYEVSDLLPQPEPISPIRLNFSDFLLKNGSSTNLDFDFDNREDSETSTKVEDKESDDTKTELKPEVPEKDEKSFTKPVRPISGTIQFIENLKRYLQPNKHKSMNSDDLKGNLQHFKVTSESQIY